MRLFYEIFSNNVTFFLRDFLLCRTLYSSYKKELSVKYYYGILPTQHSSLQLYCSNVATLQIAMQHYKDTAER